MYKLTYRCVCRHKPGKTNSCNGCVVGTTIFKSLIGCSQPRHSQYQSLHDGGGTNISESRGDLTSYPETQTSITLLFSARCCCMWRKQSELCKCDSERAGLTRVVFLLRLSQIIVSLGSQTWTGSIVHFKECAHTACSWLICPCCMASVRRR